MSQQNHENNLFDLILAAEQQQKAVDTAITELNKLKKEIKEITAQQTHATVSQSMQIGLKNGTQELQQVIRSGKNLNQELQNSIAALSWKYIGIGLGMFFALILSFMIFVMFFIPSLDEIQQRRADQKDLKKYALQLSTVNDKTVVKIMSKKCYSTKANPKVFDWCEIEPKKY